MSYERMDHAEWVQLSIDAVHARKERWTAAQHRRRERKSGWEGAPERLAFWQQQAFDVLGIAGGGIYNAPISWNAVRWHPRFIALAWGGSLATWDFRALTNLVFGMNSARLRCEIAPRTFRYLDMHISPRKPEGGMAERHPDLGESVADWFSRIPTTHRILQPRTAE